MARPNQGYHLTEKPNKHGFYEIRWSDDGRSRCRSTGCKNRRDAQGVFRSFLIGAPEIEAVVETERAGYSVAAAIVAYWREHVMDTDRPAAAPETAAYNLRWLARHFAEFYDPSFSAKDMERWLNTLSLHAGGLFIHEINDAHVTEYDRRRRCREVGKRRAGGPTIRRELGTLVSIISHAVAKKRITAAEAPDIKLPPEGLPRERWLTDDEFNELLGAAVIDEGGRMKKGAKSGRLSRICRYVVLARATWARPGALKSLKWPQVNLETQKIDLNPRGRRQTKKHRPVVPIPDWAMPVLRRAYAERTTDYVLDTPADIGGGFQRIVKQSGLVDVVPYTLRHTGATRAAQEGASMWEIAGILGDDIATVTKHYLKHSPDHLRTAANIAPAPNMPSAITPAVNHVGAGGAFDGLQESGLGASAPSPAVADASAPATS